MAILRRTKRLYLALPDSKEFTSVEETIKKAAQASGFRIVSLLERRLGSPVIRDVLLGELTRADCVVADVSVGDPNVFFELGLARAMAKTLFLLIRTETSNTIPFELREFPLFFYEQGKKGLSSLSDVLTAALKEYGRSPTRPRPIPGARFSRPFVVDWDRLDRSDFENLFRELLSQMGYRRVDWFKESSEFDLVAELPKKDPDGYEYRELWLVATTARIPPEEFFNTLRHEPDYLLHRLIRNSEHLERTLSREGPGLPITLLFVVLDSSSRQASLFDLEKLNLRTRRGSYASNFRVRVWDRNYLSGLVQQFPQIGYKYFSDEGRSRLKFRRTPEELYAEVTELNQRQAILISELEDEKNKRVRAERDAIWKDISFTAAHKIGNPIFAIETNLDPLQLRVSGCRVKEAIDVIGNIRTSVEKAKAIVDQFKSLTRAQEIKPIPTLLCPIIEDACVSARNQGITCYIDCPHNTSVMGDPDRLAECFDELVSNAVHWLNKPEKQINVQVVQPAPLPLPEPIDSAVKYLLIHFGDNGLGVALKDKSNIFNAFFTTRDHGTGIGLALVRRIVEGHGGAILETGVPGEGAHFEIYLPISTSVTQPIAPTMPI